MPKTWLNILKIVGIVLISVLTILFMIIVLSEYFPEEREELSIEGESTQIIELDKIINVITYNIGYLSLDNTQDFFMDGGKGVRPENATNVTKNLAAVKNFMSNQNADMYLFQEVDINSKRSYYINEYDGLRENFKGSTSFAYMFKSLYIPYPILSTVGHVESGLSTFNKYNVTSSTRVSLPSAYGWPKRSVMYKNCLLVERMPIKDSTKELIIINLHLDAYGKSDGKLEQLNILKSIMIEEYEKGNFVIAGGDFNATFPGIDATLFPILDDKNYVPGTISDDFLPEGWTFAIDKNTPSARLLNEEYSGNYDNSQVYIIDGFIVSPNILVNEVKVIENGFSYSDHQPVSVKLKLKK